MLLQCMVDATSGEGFTLVFASFSVEILETFHKMKLWRKDAML